MALLVYMTAASPEEARTIGDALVAGRFAACVNILGPVQSLFRWKGAVQSETETAFIAKTTQERLDGLTAEVRRLHSYEVPCIIALPILGGDAAFLDWIVSETNDASPRPSGEASGVTSNVSSGAPSAPLTVPGKDT
ncbi:divalent-cation tolerance protein CutA [Desulfovibrio psychrotolerans]|uniref:Divalent-cation tolerance protein CutA n=1 Tax=Desulfovibrio psychrotolerans TaxID=415242 RepID=A0A7J0BV84_9BACT|nr:divalent-cation tolerance protein CutA [Desulfovibrio psychrotolerans]GFM37619.1 hypothetical protein DSM19430T_23030 [Desulfovibrio psychrotolerans]